MKSDQLWLFPHPKPLVERFGEEFFRGLPKAPGVYLFCGPSEGVLYVGKAKNLRKRVGSYRVANPERLPWRIIRLLNRVTRIEWDECATEAVARFREEALIAALQPKFNVAGKVWPIPLARNAALPGRALENQEFNPGLQPLKTLMLISSLSKPLPELRAKLKL